MRALLLVGLAAGCGYRPGSFSTLHQDFPGQRTTAGCLDLSVERRADLPNGGPVLGYEFANRCDHPAVVDLDHVDLVARSIDGREVRLRAFDPNREIRALRIDGRASGNEAIAYTSSAPLAEVCVDAASIAHEPQPRWLCFATPRLEMQHELAKLRARTAAAKPEVAISREEP